MKRAVVAVLFFMMNHATECMEQGLSSEEVQQIVKSSYGFRLYIDCPFRYTDARSELLVREYGELYQKEILKLETSKGKNIFSQVLKIFLFSELGSTFDLIACPRLSLTLTPDGCVAKSRVLMGLLHDLFSSFGRLRLSDEEQYRAMVPIVANMVRNSNGGLVLSNNLALQGMPENVCAALGGMLEGFALPYLLKDMWFYAKRTLHGLKGREDITHKYNQIAGLINTILGSERVACASQEEIKECCLVQDNCGSNNFSSKQRQELLKLSELQQDILEMGFLGEIAQSLCTMKSPCPGDSMGFLCRQRYIPALAELIKIKEERKAAGK